MFKIKLKKYWPILILFAINCLLFASNYKPGTYLLGWDSTNPEFDFWLNLKRNLEGVWLSNRGLGLFDGMAHSANLPHTLGVGILMIFFHQSVVRYIVQVLLHFIGGLSMFYLIRGILCKDRSFTYMNIAALFGALFYQYNLGTIQQFYAPLEVFSYHFALLPLLLHLILKFIDVQSKKGLLLIALITFIFAPGFYVPTLFIVTTMLIIGLLFYKANKKSNFKAISLVFIVFIICNLWWLAPYIVSTVANANIVKNSKINLLSSDEAYARNHDRGTIKSTLSLKGFMLDTYNDTPTASDKSKFMGVWSDYAESYFYSFNSVIILSFSTLGIISMYRKRSKYVGVILTYLIIGLIFIGNSIPLISSFNNIIRSAFPIIGEVFRFPFTKLITLFTMSLSIFLSYGITFLTDIIKRLKRRFLREVFTNVIFTLILVNFIPSLIICLSGNFFAKNLKVNLPHEYNQTFDFLSKSPNGRVLYLPMHTFWSWQSRDWGYTGSDFIWFGIKQPLLVRAFDPWSSFNEQAFNELSYAFREGGSELIKKVLDKYSIRYVLMDTHVMQMPGTDSINYQVIQNSLARSLGDFTVKKFGSILIYDRHLEGAGTSYYSPVAKNLDSKYVDTAYLLNGNNYDNSNSKIYPFDGLNTDKGLTFKSYDIKTSDDNIYLKTKSNIDVGDYFLNIPINLTADLHNIYFVKQAADIYSIKLALPRVFLADRVVNFDDDPIIANVKSSDLAGLPNSKYHCLVYDKNRNSSIFYNGQFYKLNTKIETTNIKSIKFKLSSPSSLTLALLKTNCGESTFSSDSVGNDVNTTIELADKNIFYKTNKLNSSISIWYKSAYQQTGNAFMFNLENAHGLLPTIVVDNPSLKRNVIYQKTNIGSNFAILPPQGIGGSGLSLQILLKGFETINASGNVIDPQHFYLPYNLLEGFNLTLIKDLPKKEILTNNEAFSEYWLAYKSNFARIFNVKFLNHFLVNNWANGWELDAQTKDCLANGTCEIHIIFWPQYLQYAGYVILVLTFVAIIALPMRNKNTI